MESFFALPQEKQKLIVDAALSQFGKMGYKKTSVNDIATAAGISKGMVFHYFKNKKQMYLYLIKMSAGELALALADSSKEQVTDFFDRILVGVKIKMAVLHKHPALFKFFTSVYFEKDKEVVEEIKELLANGETVRNDFALSGLDKAKFKDSVNPALILNILVKYAEGYVNITPLDSEQEVQVMMIEFEECMTMMKNNFYKEEYL